MKRVFGVCLLFFWVSFLFAQETVPFREIILVSSDSSSFQARLHEALASMSQENPRIRVSTTANQDGIFISKIVLSNEFNSISCILEETPQSKRYSVVLRLDEVSSYPTSSWCPYKDSVQAILFEELKKHFEVKEGKIEIKSQGFTFIFEKSLNDSLGACYRMRIEKMFKGTLNTIDFSKYVAFALINPNVKSKLSQSLRKANIQNPVLFYDVRTMGNASETFVTIRFIGKDEIVSTSSKFIQMSIRLKRIGLDLEVIEVQEPEVQSIHALNRSGFKVLDPVLFLFFLDDSFQEQLQEASRFSQDLILVSAKKGIASLEQRKRGITSVYHMEFQPVERDPLGPMMIECLLGVEESREGAPRLVSVDFIEVADLVLRESQDVLLLKTIAKFNGWISVPLGESEINLLSVRFSERFMQEVHAMAIRCLFSEGYDASSRQFLDIKEKDIFLLRGAFKKTARSFRWEEAFIHTFLENAGDTWFKDFPGICSKQFSAARIAELIRRQLRILK